MPAPSPFEFDLLDDAVEALAESSRRLEVLLGEDDDPAPASPTSRRELWAALTRVWLPEG